MAQHSPDISKLSGSSGVTQVGRSPSDIVVRCIGLTKVFRDFWLRSRVRAVDGVDLEVCRGEIFGLLGPNGSGKSTTIKLILGLLHPTGGRIAVFGKRPEDVATKRLIGYLPEESYLYPFLNARETLDYYGQLFHQPRRQRQRRIDMLLEMVGLEAVQHRPVGQYSKGMQRRIGLAAALINDPQLLILDEPTSGLDPLGARQVKDLLLDLSKRQKTILLCSHLLADVEDICRRVAIMYGGKVRAAGSVDELLINRDITSLHVADLDAQSIEKIDDLLRAGGKHIEKVEKSRQRLESLFLDIIHKAQAEGVATSGAKTGGKIAAFLQETPAEDPKEVISRLVSAGEHGHATETREQPAISPPPVAHDRGPLPSQPGPVNKPTESVRPLDRLVKQSWDLSRKQNDTSRSDAQPPPPGQGGDRP